MPTEKKENIKSKSWFFKIKAKFSAFFTGLKNAFAELFNFNQDDDEIDVLEPSEAAKAEPKAEAEPEAQAQPAKALTQAQLYQIACEQDVIDAPPGWDFKVSQEELEALKLVEAQCRKDYLAKHKKEVDDYLEKHPPFDDGVIETQSKLYKEVWLNLEKSLKESPEKLALTQAQKVYQAKRKKGVDDYFKKNPSLFGIIDTSSAHYKEVSLNVEKSLKASPEKLALTQARKVYQTTLYKKVIGFNVELSLKASAEKLALTQAGKAAQALKEKHIEAYTYAIQKHGKGKLLKLNGICLDRIQNVGGMNNNCGANVMLHVFLENWDKLNFEDENTKSLGRNLFRAAKKNNPKLKITTIAKLKAHIDSFSFSQQEAIFTPAVRTHLGKTLKRSENYFEKWVGELQLSKLGKELLKDEDAKKASHQNDLNWDHVLFSSPEYKSYYKYRFNSPQERAKEKLAPLEGTGIFDTTKPKLGFFARIKTKFLKLNKEDANEFVETESSKQEKNLKKAEINEKMQEEQAEKQGLEKALFKSRYVRLGDEENAIQIAEYELFEYAKIMGIGLKVYSKEGNVTKPRLEHNDHDGLNPISVNIVNLGEYHWQYERNWDLPKEAVLEAVPGPALPPVTKGGGPNVPPAKPKKEAPAAPVPAPAPAVLDNKPAAPKVPPARP